MSEIVLKGIGLIGLLDVESLKLKVDVVLHVVCF